MPLLTPQKFIDLGIYIFYYFRYWSTKRSYALWSSWNRKNFNS